MKTFSFNLINFNGPLELLYLLIHKEEVSIYDIKIQNLIEQFATTLNEEGFFEKASDFLHYASLLLLLKSRKLLPSEPEAQEDEEHLRLEMIEHLIEYQSLKDLAFRLEEREEKERTFFPRGKQHYLPKRERTGLEEVTLDDLVTALSELLTKAKKEIDRTIVDEEWHVSTKINWLKTKMLEEKTLFFEALFSQDLYKEELIALFLALLELIKVGEIKIKRRDEKLILES